jgi:hypothetical protein
VCRLPTSCFLPLLLAPALLQPLSAHHSILGFDATRSVTVRGVVSQVLWIEPHTHIVVSDEAQQRWVIEIESPTVLQRLGWTKQSIRAGDRIWSVGAPARDGARIMRCEFVALPAGLRLPCLPRPQSRS